MSAKVKVYYAKDREWNEHLAFPATAIGIQDGCLKIFNDNAPPGRPHKTIIANGIWRAAEVIDGNEED